MTEKQGIDLLPYGCQRNMLRAIEAAGHPVTVRRNRNGSLRIAIDGRRETDVRTAMERTEAIYATLRQTAA